MNSPTLLTSHLPWAGVKPSESMFTKIVSPRETLKINTIWTQIHFFLWQLLLVRLNAWETLKLWSLSFSYHNSTLTSLEIVNVSRPVLWQQCLYHPARSGLSSSVTLQYWGDDANKGSPQRQQTPQSKPLSLGFSFHPKIFKFRNHGSFLLCPLGHATH